MMLDMQNDLDAGQKDRGDDAHWNDAPPEGPVAANNGGRRGGGGGGTDAPEAEAPARDAKRDLRNTWQVLAGSVLIPLGVILILIAWYGAAHARVVQQQIPYLVSGSFVGLGCMVLGGFFFFSHWLYRMYDQAGLHHEEQMRVLEAIAAGAAGASWRAAGAPGAAGVPLTVTPGTVTGGLDSFYATGTGTVYHRADCAVIAHHPDDLRVLGADGLTGMLPCQICAPD
jgi:hypothetical protein